MSRNKNAVCKITKGQIRS